MLLCPDKNSAEWKALASKVGNVGAYQAWIANSYEIPPADKVVQSNLEEVKGRARPHNVVKIISNGTDGVGKIALSVSRELKFGTGGRAVYGGAVEGADMDEHHNTNIPETVKQNVEDSEATIIFGKSESTAVKVAKKAAEEAGKPFLINPTSDEIKDFVVENKVSVLNVAGDRDNKMTQNDSFKVAATLKEALEIPIAKQEEEEMTPDLELLALTEAKTATQADLIDRLKDVHNRIEKANDPDGTGRYALDGNIFKKRVTEYAQELTDEKFGVKVYEGEANPIFAETGNKIHDVMEQLVLSLFNGTEFKTPRDAEGKALLSDAMMTKLGKGAKKIVEDIKATQRRIDSSKNAEIMTEITLADADKSIAGTVDLLVTYSDGSVAIFDWKSSMHARDKSGKIVAAMGRRKQFQYGSQIAEYKRILRAKYGVNAFRQSRLVPIDVQYQTKETEAGRKIFTRLKNISLGEEASEYLAQIPVAEEMTNQKELDEMLTSLLSVEKELALEQGGRNSAEKIEKLNKRLSTVKKAVRDIQLKSGIGNIASALKEVSDYSTETLENISINNPKDPNYIDDIKTVRLTVNAYKAVLENGLKYIKKFAKGEKKEQYEEAYGKAVTALNNLDSVILDKAKERLIFDSSNAGIEGILDAQKEVGMMSRWFKHLNDWENPSIDLLNTYIQKIQDNTRNRTRELAEEIEKEIELFQASKGKGMNAFDNLINKETGNLVAKFSTEFYKTREELMAKKDIKSLKKLYEYTDEGQKKYEKDKERQMEFYKKLYKDPKQYNQLMSKWVAQNNLADNSSWVNTKTLQRYAKLKNPEQHYNSAYSAIQADPASARFYNFYTAKMNELMKIIPVGKRKMNTFIPNIQKDTIDAIIQSKGRSLKTLGKSFIDSLEVREDDNTFGMIDNRTGKAKRVIPVLYMTPLRNAEGKVDNTRKSFDLGRNLLLFASSAYNYKYASEMEAKVNTLKEVVAEQKNLVLDQSGNVIKDSLGRAVKALGTNTAAEVIEKYADYYLYGHKLQGIDKKFKYKNKTYSSAKAISRVISHYSLKTLGMNPISAVANVGGATANAFMTGKKGKYYTNKQFRGVMLDIIKPGNKTGIFAGFFDPFTDDMNFRRANDLSANRLSKWLTVDNLMIMQRKTDEFVDKSVAAAMGKNYGIDPNTNRVVRLSRLPEGSKSLFDLATVVDGKMKIEGLTEDGYNQFRSMVKHVAGNIKGQTSKESINLVQTTVLGRVLMQFRSWLPQLAQERFRDPKYNNNVDEVELGRFRVAFGEIAAKGFLPTLKSFTAELLVGGFGKSAYKLNENVVDEKFTEFVTNNPAALKKHNYNLESLKAVYLEERMGQMRAMAAELRMYLTVLAGILAMGSDWDDDDEPDYKNYAWSRAMYAHIDRLSLELGFFISPSEGIQLLNKPVAIMSYATEIQNLMENTITETYDFVSGEEDTRDKTPMGYYTLKQMYGINAISKYLRDVLDAFEE